MKILIIKLLSSTKNSNRKSLCQSIHNFIKTCEFEEKTPTLWVDRSFIIDGTGKVITVQQEKSRL